MRPTLEVLPLPQGASWSALNRRLDDGIPFEWHHHPELELTLTLNSAGQRFIGDHVGSYGPGDLVLIGPNLPHSWVSRETIEAEKPHVALVFWFRADWLETMLAGAVELEPIRALVARADGGLAFPAAVGRALAADYERVFTLPPLERLLALLAILARLAKEDGAEPLSSRAPRATGEGRSRIDRVLTHLHRHYAEPVTLGALADIAALSVSGLHRLFARHLRTSVTAYVAALRIGDAAARLAATDQPIAHIASAVGYASPAHFNRQFKALRGMTPRAYRARFKRSGA